MKSQYVLAGGAGRIRGNEAMKLYVSEAGEKDLYGRLLRRQQDT